MKAFPKMTRGEWDMRPFYDAAFEPARRIIRRVHEETRRIRQTQNRDIPEMAGIPEIVIADIKAEVPERRRAFEGR